MAVPIIQLGQCGNQVGQALFDRLFNEGTVASAGHQGMLSQFFGNGNLAKALLIDMEPKVVGRNLMLKKPWKYNKNYSIVQQQGSGNNWAYGCYQHGPRVRDSIVQKMRHLSQQQDYIQCLFQIQSLAGGTGSGLGTFIMQLLSEQYPKMEKINICIMPHLSGQVILQSYNTVLSLSTLYQQSDGIMIIENDRVQEICNKEFKLDKPSLDDINSIIGRQLGSVFFPVIDKRLNDVFSIQQNGFKYASDLIRHVVYDPKYKLMNVRTAPNMPKNSESFNSDSWQAVENSVQGKAKLKSKGSILIARGPDHPQTFNSPCYMLDSHRFGGYHHSATLIDNNQLFVDSLDKIVTRCTQMLSEKAYLYQYEKYGLEPQQFTEQLAIFQSILQNYVAM